MKLCLVCNFQYGDEQDLCPKDLSKLVPVGKDPLIGMQIQDKYRIESLVAKGSMGSVYKAHQDSIGREVAVKVMHGFLVNDEESMKRYHKEAKAASRLNHPNITAVYDFGVLASGQPYIVMDLITGKALADILQQRGQLTVNQTLMVMHQVCQALAEAHGRGIVHRDIKPENIVIDEMGSGKGIHVKVVDFGIATFAAEGEDTIGKITKTGTVCGSPFYMSPEQCDGGKVDRRSDLYSLGIVLFEALTGKVPFESKDIYQVLAMQVKDPPPRLHKMRPDLEFTPELERVVAKSLAKEPSARFQSAEEFWQSLRAAATRSGGRAPTTQELVSGQNIGPIVGSYSEESVDPEVLRRKIQEANGLLQERAERAQAELEERKRKRKQTVSTADRIVSVAQVLVPPLLTVLISGALFWVIAHQSIIQGLLAQKPAVESSNQTDKQSDTDAEAKAAVQNLISLGKLEEAKSLLESRRSLGRFDGQDRSNLDEVIVKMAKKEAKSKHYKQALAYLDQVSTEGRADSDIKGLAKKWKRLAK